MKFYILRIIAPCLLLGSACFHVRHESEPIRVEPIHITVDVNVKVDKALDDFFGDLDRRSETIRPPEPEAEATP